MLKRIFGFARSGPRTAASASVFVFANAGSGRDVTFLGLAVPGASDLDAPEELVAIWRTSGGSRFSELPSRFTVLDAATISRTWIDTMIAGARDDAFAPEAWRHWLKTGQRRALRATRSLEYRTRVEQLPNDSDTEAIVGAIRTHFRDRPHAFEHCAAAMARLMIPDIAVINVTRPSRDGGRDAVGQLRVGYGASSILVDFALEAKCYSPPNAVGVRDVSRLISRLRHRQFVSGVLIPPFEPGSELTF